MGFTAFWRESAIGVLPAEAPAFWVPLFPVPAANPSAYTCVYPHAKYLMQDQVRAVPARNLRDHHNAGSRRQLSPNSCPR